MTKIKDLFFTNLLLVILVQVLAKYTGDLWELSQDLGGYLVLV